MRRNPIEMVTGLIVLIVAFGFLGWAISRAGTGGSSGGGYTLYASFSSVAGLNVGSDVRMAGVKVGTVDSEVIDPKTYLARIAMTVRKGLEIPRDSGLSVASESLLGGEYLSISPGGDTAMLKPGESFTATQGAVSLEDLLGKFIFSATNMVSAMTSPKSGAGAGGGASSGSAASTGSGSSSGKGSSSLMPPLGQ
jgi:phospholipid/cholesterol/gamma-HCH transport system substrate-binding protein